ncbi:MAG: tetratricopeptide repeat protein [bacterium]
MSLIEKALTKKQSTDYPQGVEAPPHGPDPANLLGQPRRLPRIGLMALLGLLMGLAVVGGWALMVYLPQDPSPGEKSFSKKELPANSGNPLVATEDSSGKAFHTGPQDNELQERVSHSSASAISEKAPGALQQVQAAPPGSQPGADKETHHPSASKPPKLAGSDSLAQGSQGASLKSESPKQAPKPRPVHSSHPREEQTSRIDEKQRLLLGKAYIKAQAGHLQEALEIYNQVLARYPNEPEALVNRGVLRMRMGDLSGAKRDLLQAKVLQPQDSTLLNALGVLCLETGELDEAAHYFRSSTEPAALINLALLYWRKQNQDRALELLTEAQARIPQEPWLAYYRALLLREMGRSKEAQEELERARGLARKKGDMELMQKLEATRGAP